MILEFRCSNFKSIRNEISFTSVAGSDTSHSDELIQFNDEYRVIRSAAVYGANGSGKSNFIQAIGFMKKLVSESIGLQPGQSISGYAPHKLCDPDEPGMFMIKFVKNNKRFCYKFSILNNEIIEEDLYFFPKGYPVRIFHRQNLDVQYGDKFRTFRNMLDVSRGVLKSNRLFLSCTANYTNVPEIEDAFRFFSEDMVFYTPDLQYSVQLMNSDQFVRDRFIDLLGELGTGIKGVRLPSDSSRIEAKVIYDMFETDLLNEESAGVRKLFEILCPVIDIQRRGRILLCDELESSLHESLIVFLIRLFTLNKESTAQMIFTTHDTSILDSSIFRRDQIWFTELDERRSTDLYSLASVRNVRKTENFRKGYLEGRYGAIPVLSHNLLRFLNS